MMIEERHKLILEELKANPSVTVKELSKKLFVSEPTIRRDFTELHNKGIITKIHGGAIINTAAAYREIPFFLRGIRGNIPARIRVKYGYPFRIPF